MAIEAGLLTRAVAERDGFDDWRGGRGCIGREEAFLAEFTAEEEDDEGIGWKSGCCLDWINKRESVLLYDEVLDGGAADMLGNEAIDDLLDSE